ncbi:MAG: hypothetical protein PHF86_06315 [Candidatus Nanoarchaeia archaeon]|nr:hypothetical protein [Candidatus Nanoarchaeia archaeon]
MLYLNYENIFSTAATTTTQEHNLERAAVEITERQKRNFKRLLSKKEGPFCLEFFELRDVAQSG